MRFPSLTTLAERAAAVLRRFPWTLAAGSLAAAAAIAASRRGAGHGWDRAAFVAALGLPLSVALTLLGEARRWSPGTRTAVLAAGAAALAAFYVAWPGIDAAPDAVRYLRLSAALHLSVAFLPFVGARESVAFWQYNRRLFLGFNQAVVFSGVVFVGVAIALGALDHLFGVRVPSEAYVRIWFVVAFVVNTWIFLARVPGDLAALEGDADYPRGLKVFAQYVLTPLAFTYLVILLAYLVKIVVGGEWPSGWIGWLVASVSVTGLLGFLLVHPLRAAPDEGWIRTYARWLFVGLIPAAVMLLVAFGKRIAPYGLTEPRLLGILLGLWLLGIAVLFTIRREASIRVIPVSLAALLLGTLYGPLSLTRLSVASQGRRLARMLATRPRTDESVREASAALRFLLERGAGDEITARVGRRLPPVDWAAARRAGEPRDSLARRIMALAGSPYTSEWNAVGTSRWFSVDSDGPVPVAGFDWVLPAQEQDTASRLVGDDTVRVLARDTSGVARIRAGADTLVFDLRPIARRYADSMPQRRAPRAELSLDGSTPTRKALLALTQVSGRRTRDSVVVEGWTGWVLLGR